MPDRAVDDKPSDTLVVVSGEGFWTGSSTLPHLHHFQLPRPGVSLFRNFGAWRHDFVRITRRHDFVDGGLVGATVSSHGVRSHCAPRFRCIGNAAVGRRLAFRKARREPVSLRPGNYHSCHPWATTSAARLKRAPGTELLEISLRRPVVGLGCGRLMPRLGLV